MYAALRSAVWPTYRTRPRLLPSRLPSSTRTFRATAIQRNTPPSNSNSTDATVQPDGKTSEVKENDAVNGKVKEKDEEAISASKTSDSLGWADTLKSSLGLDTKISEISTSPSPATGGRLTPSRLKRAQRARHEAAILKNELELPDWFAQRCVKLWDPNVPLHYRPLESVEHFKKIDPKIGGETPEWYIDWTKFNAEPNFYHKSPPPKTTVDLDCGHYLEIAAITAGSFATVSAAGRNTFWGLKANLALYCAFDGGNTWLNSIVDRVARDQQADILRLDAQDIMELGGAYVSPDAQDFLSLRTLGFDAFQNESHEDMEDEMDEDEAEEEEEEPGSPPGIEELSRIREQMKSAQEKMGKGAAFSFVLPPGLSLPEEIRKSLPGIEEALKNSPFMSASSSREKSTKKERRTDKLEIPTSTPIDNRRLTAFWDTVIENARAQRKADNQLESSERKLMICIEDFMSISATPVGEQLLESLADNIQRRRGERGEKIMIVGTTSSSELAGDEDAQKELETESEGSYYRTVLVAPDLEQSPPSSFKSMDSFWAHIKRRRNAVTNLRNIQWMLKQIEPEANTQDMSLIPTLVGFTKDAHADVYEEKTLYDQVLKQEDAQRIALTATGLRASGLWNAYVHDVGGVSPSTSVLIKVALIATQYTDQARIASVGKSDFSITKIPGALIGDKAKLPKFPGFPPGLMPWTEEEKKKMIEEEKESSKSAEIKARLETLKASCNRHEARLFGGIVHPDSIKTTFKDVHVAMDTVDAVRTLTSLSLLRPDAFKYGVLATDNISGLLLYGPPGTGKTLLAKAVAKESGATVLTVSGSDVNQMYVGESEKVVKAVFSLARKLAPCVVFIDEADALLGARQGKSSHKANHRDTINQLLLEWDGLDPIGVFLMVATNRPFDLDDAVLRRLPRRVLVDLPTKEDREAILRIHLQNEQLDPSVSIPLLAQQTPYYSGSDLKNLAVSAALSCIKEENEAKKLAEANGVKDFMYAERRTLMSRHFEVAVGEIAASISADMSSLKDIRKFDEQYGDRKGRKKKNSFGFLEEVKREESARVRG